MRTTPEAKVVRDELGAMYEDHVAVGQLLTRIRELSDEFTLPAWGCNTYRVYMAELAALEDDILRHVHLENHVLLPRFAAVGAPRAAAEDGQGIDDEVEREGGFRRARGGASAEPAVLHEE